VGALKRADSGCLLAALALRFLGGCSLGCLGSGGFLGCLGLLAAKLEGPVGASAPRLNQFSRSHSRLEVLSDEESFLHGIDLVGGADVPLDGMQRRAARILQSPDGAFYHLRSWWVRCRGDALLFLGLLAAAVFAAAIPAVAFSTFFATFLASC
jgi:hypothetical protein